MACKIIGCGSYLPNQIVTNFDLEKKLPTNDEWIKTRTGISQRHIAEENEYSSHMALKAAQMALLDAQIDAKDLDLIIVCTTTPDNSMPSTASRLQGCLGLEKTPSFDMQAVCSGFIYGLDISSALIASGKYETILLVCSEKMSALLNWEDRSTCILFGDGAGAIILQKNKTNHIIDSKIHSNGKLYDILTTDGGICLNGKSGVIKMKGQEVFKNAVEKMSSSIEELLLKNNLTVDQIDHFIPHQANIRIIENLVQKLNFDNNKVIKTVTLHANCSAASIPLALNEAKNLGKLKSEDLILFSAVGAGLTWGSAIVKW